MLEDLGKVLSLLVWLDQLQEQLLEDGYAMWMAMLCGLCYVDGHAMLAILQLGLQNGQCHLAATKLLFLGRRTELRRSCGEFLEFTNHNQ